MTPRVRCAAIITLLLLALPPAAARANPAAEAKRLYESALDHLMLGTFDTRRAAIGELEQATLLAPANPEYEITLARTYLQAGYLKSARLRFDRVARLTPGDAATRYGLGLVWRRDWLKYVDAVSLDHAVENFSLAARLDTTMVDAWLMLTPLLIEQGRLTAAAAAAQHAAWARPDLPETQLALASAAYRGGDLPRAENLFTRAIPRLVREVRSHFDDISPLASERDTMELHRLGLLDAMEFERRFWKEHDPDPATPENEVRLEYWSRVAQAYFLYYDARLRQWDERGEVYVRYGPPEHVVYNPVAYGYTIAYGDHTTFVSEFPANTLLWSYASLGMDVVLQDRLLSERYMLPVSFYSDPDPRPDPGMLALRDDALATHDMKGVFHTLPPGARPLGVNGTIARFEGTREPRVLVAAEAPGGPVDSLWATWVALDSTEVEVAREVRTLSPSACDPTTSRVADFMGSLPPGGYRIAVSVRSRGGRRGVFRTLAELEPIGPDLSLSDVVVVCGPPDVNSMPIRLAANPSAVVEGSEALTAYFEIYHLTPDDEGRSHFEYVYTVRTAERDPRIWLQRMVSPRPSIPSITASRGEENPGSLRRQFLSVPVQPLSPGSYWLEVHVKDLTTGAEAERRALFRKRASAPLEIPAGAGGEAKSRAH
ncbi:MAG: GWxTD domain-containing protein [Candidatus Eisenbacteria bacterium]|nr:GWxTD domain-containing protein [Candidatus Eisenbacteria bacterium]